MPGFDRGWSEYVPVAVRLEKAEREMAKLRKKGVTISPVKLESKKIATTFWGKAWCDNLESYHDYENRLPRGRTYIRNGSVVDLQIAPHEITAMVSGSSVYKVKISIGEVAKAHWKSICTDCSGGIDSLVELLQGRFSKGVMERICRQGAGLFPKPSEIKFSCSCPDYASMCKHVAAALYGVGARLDAKPELLFRLRAVNENDLVAGIGKVLPMSKQGPAAGKVLEADDMAAMFGLDMGDADASAAGVPAKRKSAATKKTPVTAAATKKTSATVAATKKATPVRKASGGFAPLKKAPSAVGLPKGKVVAKLVIAAKPKTVPKPKVVVQPKGVTKPKIVVKQKAVTRPKIATQTNVTVVVRPMPKPTSTANRSGVAVEVGRKASMAGKKPAKAK